jgi:3-oxoacyl-[acyl-carrier protein] reductase
MNLGLEGTTALVTGASRGMGRAAAAALAAEGVRVTIVARGIDALAEAAETIARETGGTVVPVAADITSEAGRTAALAACPAPDILVNNGDGMPPGNFRDWTRADWQEGLERMMLAPIEMIRLTVDGMCDRGFGRIVNIVSRSVKIAQPELGLSNAARSGLVGFVAGIARETIRHGVTINNVLPGIVASDGQRRHVEALARDTGRPFDDIWHERAARNPAGRYGEPEEIGSLVAWLASRHAGFVTAQNLLIDGGEYPGTY